MEGSRDRIQRSLRKPKHDVKGYIIIRLIILLFGADSLYVKC